MEASSFEVINQNIGWADFARRTHLTLADCIDMFLSDLQRGRVLDLSNCVLEDDPSIDSYTKINRYAQHPRHLRATSRGP